MTCNCGRALRYWLRGRKDDDNGFLLAIDQFGERFTFAAPEERQRVVGAAKGAASEPRRPLPVAACQLTAAVILPRVL